MSDKELLLELDKNMDMVFDSLNIVNSVVSAIVQSLPKSSALQVVTALDSTLKAMRLEANPVSDQQRMALRAWRNTAALIAKLPPVDSRS